MKLSTKRALLSVVVSAAMAAPMVANATNGMNLEGYGPIATGMGGASMAYDNGTAAMMNNPATLGLMADGDSRVDLALGFLGPHVSLKSSMYGNATSSADKFWMPAVGYATRNGQLTYGLGVFAQGGMGTEYNANSPYCGGTGTSTPFLDTKNCRSEVGVGRLMLPIAFNVNDNVTVAASADFVWAGMDLVMAMGTPYGANNQMDMSMTSLPSIAHIAAAGKAAGVYAGAMGTGDIASVFGTFPGEIKIDFSNDNAFTGEAKGYGLAGKIGAVFKVNDMVALGLTYHSQTNLSDLSAGGILTGAMGISDKSVPVSIKVKNFQWPSQYGAGISLTPSDRLQLAADVQRINWSDVMESMQMRVSDTSGGYIDMILPQQWSDQTVFNVGGAYKLTDKFTMRAGYNHASNPIPSSWLNYLFPAIVESHVTLGAGYQVDPQSAVNFSITRALAADQTSPGGFSVSHDQINWQLMYSMTY